MRKPVGEYAIEEALSDAAHREWMEEVRAALEQARGEGAGLAGIAILLLKLVEEA